jgi:hypothetical protein
MTEMSPLRRRMIEDMTIRNLSPTTQQSYLNAVSKFSRHFGRSPDRLGLEDVRAFQVHLVATGISWPALNQIVCALRFFYGVTLGQAVIPVLLRLEHSHRPAMEDHVHRATRLGGRRSPIVRIGITQQPRKPVLSFAQWQGAEVLAVKLQEVEGVKHGVADGAVASASKTG